MKNQRNHDFLMIGNWSLGFVWDLEIWIWDFISAYSRNQGVIYGS